MTYDDAVKAAETLEKIFGMRWQIQTKGEEGDEYFKLMPATGELYYACYTSTEWEEVEGEVLIQKYRAFYVDEFGREFAVTYPHEVSHASDAEGAARLIIRDLVTRANRTRKHRTPKLGLS